MRARGSLAPSWLLHLEPHAFDHLPQLDAGGNLQPVVDLLQVAASRLRLHAEGSGRLRHGGAAGYELGNTALLLRHEFLKNLFALRRDGAMLWGMENAPSRAVLDKNLARMREALSP